MEIAIFVAINLKCIVYESEKDFDVTGRDGMLHHGVHAAEGAGAVLFSEWRDTDCR